MPSAAISVVVALLLLGCSSRHEAPGRDEFHQGRDAVVAGNFERAVEVLEAYRRAYPSERHASRAGLFLGKAYLALGRLDDARTVFGETAARFSSTLEGHKCRYKLGVVELLAGAPDKALAIFEGLANTPDGPLAAESVAMVRFLAQAEAP